MNLKSEILKFNQYVELFKYEHIAFGIIDAIQNGSFKVGDKLPSINELLDTIGYARATIDKAYKLLIRQGIVKSVKYKGYFVLNAKIKASQKASLETISFKKQD